MSITETPTQVKPRQSLAEAAAANLATGVLLLCKEALITAIQDRRCQRGHLRVLAALVTFISTNTAKAWPSRAAIGAATGVSERSVSNTMLELRNWGYVIADREAVEQAGGKRLMVYTFGNIDHDTIRREICAWVERAKEARGPDKVTTRGEVNSSPPRVNITTQGEHATSPPAVKFTAKGDVTSPPAVQNSSPPAVHSNSIKELDSNRGGEYDAARAGSTYNKSPHTAPDGSFVISIERQTVIPAATVNEWRRRFKHIADLDALMQRLAVHMLSKVGHPAWNCPDGWMVGCLAENDQKAANEARVAASRMAKKRPSGPSRW